MAELQYFPFTSTSLACWDLQNHLGFLNADMSLAMDGPFISSPQYQYDFSSGYLEDAFLEFNDRSKRRRFELNEYFDWNSPETENLSCFNKAQQTPENQKISVQETTIDSSSSSSKNSPKTKSTCHKDSRPYLIAGEEDLKRKKRGIKGVVYPFAMIKPGGGEGEITINDINERILMPPTRPLRHPVGDFACRPSVSAAGAGLSGKAVVALTRIHTRGRGTITIIRTKG